MMKRTIYTAMLITAAGLMALVCWGCGGKEGNASPEAGPGQKQMKVAASSSQDAPSAMKAGVKFSGSSLADYVIVGMHDKASDGFDNAFDTFSPGAPMVKYETDPYFTVYMLHEGWSVIKDEYKGDLRAVKYAEQWTVTVKSTNGFTEELTMSLMPEKTDLNRYAIAVEDLSGGDTVDLVDGSYSFTLPANAVMEFRVTVEGDSYTLTGTLTDEDMEPVAGATVKISGNGFTLSATSGADGGFTLAGVPSGSYTLTATRNGYAALSESVTVN
jgi:hypothetical protein